MAAATVQKKSVTYSWGEKPSDQEGMVTLVIPTSGGDYLIDMSVDTDDFGKVGIVVSVQANLGAPKA
jgi:hypothetical protein